MASIYAQTHSVNSSSATLLSPVELNEPTGCSMWCPPVFRSCSSTMACQLEPLACQGTLTVTAS